MKIKSVEFCGKEEVYDIEVPGVNCFPLSNNVVTHNSSHYLGRSYSSFEETFGKDANLSLLDPTEVAFYASCDAACTFGLYEVLYPVIEKECPFIIKLDNKLARAMYFYLQSKIYLNVDRMKELVEFLQEKLHKIEGEVFKMVGRPFDLQSNRQVSTALLSIGVDTGVRTKTGDLKLDKKTLGKIKHPVCQMIVEHGSISTQLNNYASKFIDKKEGRINYNIFAVPTGRVSSGSEKKGKTNSFYLNLNYQNLTKAKPAVFVAKYVGEQPGNILGYSFEEVTEGRVLESDECFVEGMSQEINIRSAITVPDENWLFVAIDYVGEETRIAGLLSKDPVYVEAYKNNEDVHKYTAHGMFGKENYNKEKRRLAKIAIFALLYGGSSWTIQNSSGLDEQTCKDLYNRFWSTMKILKRWKRDQVSFACRNKGVYQSLLGRPRRLKHWLGASDYKSRMYGERSVASHAVQGLAGDVMRILLVNLYEKIFKQSSNLDEIRFGGCVHDEVHFLIRRELFNKWVPVLQDLMTFTLKGWEYPLTVSVEVGTSYGNLFPFSKQEGVWKPVKVS